MALGLSTYAFLWRRRFGPEPTMVEMFEAARAGGCEVFQICDHPALERGEPAELAGWRAAAADLGLRLQTGTRGLDPAHLRAHLARARALGADLVRTMSAPAGRPAPGVADSVAALREVEAEFADAATSLAIETYEVVPTSDLVRVVEEVGSPWVGVCLDPGNCLAALERPADVVAACAPHVLNVHVKDVAFTRAEGTVGFVLAGAPLGTGVVGYDAMAAAVDAAAPPGRRVDHVLEHWMPRVADEAETCRCESAWVAAELATLRARLTPG